MPVEKGILLRYLAEGPPGWNSFKLSLSSKSWGFPPGESIEDYDLSLWDYILFVNKRYGYFLAVIKNIDLDYMTAIARDFYIIHPEVVEYEIIKKSSKDIMPVLLQCIFKKYAHIKVKQGEENKNLPFDESGRFDFYQDFQKVLNWEERCCLKKELRWEKVLMCA